MELKEAAGAAVITQVTDRSGSTVLRRLGVVFGGLVLAVALPAQDQARPAQRRAAVAAESSVPLTVRAAGATGSERMQLRVADVVVGEWILGTSFAEYSAAVGAATTFDDIAVGFVGGGPGSGGHVEVDHVRLGDLTREGAGSDVYSSGQLSPGRGCTAGLGVGATLGCIGFLHFGGIPDGTPIRVYASGSTGSELLQILVDGTPRASFQVQATGIAGGTLAEGAMLVYQHPGDVAPERVRMAFVNNGYEHGADRNLRIDRVQIGSTVYESEHPTVQSLGAWANGAQCRAGRWSTDVLYCNGWFQYSAAGATVAPGAPTPVGSKVVIRARGAVGTEQIELQIDGTTVARHLLSTVAADYAHVHTGPVTAGQVRVAFVNNAFDAGRDRNVWVDRIEIDGERHESEAPAVVSRGAWANGAQCREGRFSTDFLACNGWFQYGASSSGGNPTGQTGPVVPRLRVQVVADGLSHPWGLGFLPDGSMLFTERVGRVRLLSPSGGLSTVTDDFPDLGTGTDGLMGLAVDPEVATNGRFYTCQGSRLGGLSIQAWELASDRRSAVPVQTLVSEARPTGGHSGCRLRVDGDGWLWATIGDAYLATNPQDPAVISGKVLRIDRHSGAGHPENPDLGPGTDRRIVTLGHRNPQGLDFRPGTGEAWIVEHGPDIEDEINRLVAGGNYGWNPVGPIGQDGRPTYAELNRTMTDPAIPGARQAWWSSGLTTIAPGGLAFVTGDAWGEVSGGLAVTTLKDTKLRFFRFGPDGRFNGQTIAAELDGTYGRLREVLRGPDGALYISTSNTPGTGDGRLDRILRVAPAGAGAVATEVTVTGRGTTGTERIELQVDGVVVASYILGTTSRTYRYDHIGPVTADQVRVAFVNNGYDAGRDRNATIDRIGIAGRAYESEHPAVRSRGLWVDGARCGEGYFRSETLYCNGWLQYSSGG